MRTVATVVLVLLLVPLLWLAGFVVWWNVHSIPRRAYERLLAGDRGVRIESLVLTREGRRLVIDDPAAAEYLTEAFRASRETGELFSSTGVIFSNEPEAKEARGGGPVYEAELRLSSGTARCHVFFPNKGGSIWVSEPIDPWYMNDPHLVFLVPLPEPLPQQLAQVLAEVHKADPP